MQESITISRKEMKIMRKKYGRSQKKEVIRRQTQKLSTLHPSSLANTGAISNPRWSLHILDSNKTPFLHSLLFLITTLFKFQKDEIENVDWDGLVSTKVSKMTKHLFFSKTYITDCPSITVLFWEWGF